MYYPDIPLSSGAREVNVVIAIVIVMSFYGSLLGYEGHVHYVSVVLMSPQSRDSHDFANANVQIVMVLFRKSSLPSIVNFSGRKNWGDVGCVPYVSAPSISSLSWYVPFLFPDAGAFVVSY